MDTRRLGLLHRWRPKSQAYDKCKKLLFLTIHISLHGCTQVPTNAGYWIWNAWSSGDPCWSSGPPLAESVTQIKSIEIFKGYTENVANTTSNCVSGAAAVAVSPSTAIAKSEATQIVPKCVCPPSHLETLLKYQTRNSIRLLLLAGIFTALPWLTGVIFTIASQSS